MLNTVTIMGRLVKDPELRQTQGGKNVTSFTLAVERDFQKGVCDYINVVAWGNLAMFANRYFFKGKMAVASGRLQSRKWTDRNGQNRTDWEVNAENLYFGDEKKREYQQSDGYAAGEPEYKEPEPMNELPGGDPFDNYSRPQESFYQDDGELPF